MNSTYDAVFKVIETDVEILAKAINQAISDSEEVQIINDFLTELKSLLDDANNEAVKIIRTGTDQQDSIIERLKNFESFVPNHPTTIKTILAYPQQHCHVFFKLITSSQQRLDAFNNTTSLGKSSPSTPNGKFNQ